MNTQSNGIGNGDIPADVGDRGQNWVFVYEDRFGGYIGQLVGIETSPQSIARIRNAFAYEKRIIVFGGPVVQGPNQAAILKGQAEEQRNVWDLEGVSPDDVLCIASPQIVLRLADASPDMRTAMNGAITVIEQARKAKLSAKLGLDLSGKIDPAVLAKMKRPG